MTAFSLSIRGKTVPFQRPCVMGILNLGADSFSGDGIPDLDRALERARAIVQEGADILDVGAESARTNRGPISEEEEAAQLIGFLERWSDEPKGHAGAGDRKPLLSINTWRPAVIQEVLKHGGDILNDISGLADPVNAGLCAECGVPLVVMHTQGLPKVPHTHVQYRDVMDEMETFFEERIVTAQSAGLGDGTLILDPGIDFAKQRDDNLMVYRHLERLKRFGFPILLPVSRKTVIGEVLGIREPAARDAGTQACIVAGFQRGASIFRVHNVRAAVLTVETLTALHG